MRNSAVKHAQTFSNQLNQAALLDNVIWTGRGEDYWGEALGAEVFVVESWVWKRLRKPETAFFTPVLASPPNLFAMPTPECTKTPPKASLSTRVEGLPRVPRMVAKFFRGT